MELIKSYKDLLTAEIALQEQIDLTKHEIYEWYGVDLDENRGLPFGSKLAKRTSFNTAVKQTDERFLLLDSLETRLQAVQLKKEKLQEHMEKVTGLDHAIAYRRLVEGKSHKEIAAELCYSYDYIRERWSAMNKASRNDTYRANPQ